MTTELPIATQADVEAMRACQTDLLIAGAQGDQNAWRRAEQAFAAHRIASNTEARRAVIEECAKVADSKSYESILSTGATRARDIATAIRALAKATQ